jgi:sugar lactone lactonase YvrE
MTTAERLNQAGLILGEGPISLGEDRFACVDIRRGLVLEGNLDGSLTELRRYDGPVSALAELDDGGLLVATRHGIETLAQPPESVQLPESNPKVRMNDGKPDPRGRFIAGTMADPVLPHAGDLWSFANGRATRLIGGVTISNGLCWSADASTMYHIDTPTRRIDAFDYDLDTGTITNRRTITMIDDDLGDPDGMTIDADGGLWVAMWGGGAVLRYDHDQLTDRIEVPTPYVTCPVFVGARLDTLLVTTASEPRDSGPGAGDLYFAVPGTSGSRPTAVRRELVFAGNQPPA